MHAITAPPEITPADRLGVTVFFAIVAHLIVILGVTFVPEDHRRSRASTFDVVLVQHEAEKVPDKPDYLAQANQDGGGNSDTKARPSTPLPAPFEAPTPAIAAAALPPAPPAPPALQATVPATPAPPPPQTADSAPPEPVLAQHVEPTPTKVAEPVPARRPTKASKPEPARRAAPKPKKAPLRFADAMPQRRVAPDPPRSAAPARPSPPQPTRTVEPTTIANRDLAMATLRAEIDRRLQAYAERPRRKWISARTREHKYAAYMEAWRRKVERIGNLNYPDAARRNNLSGTLLLDVALNPDGTVKDITLRRSSGKKVLDDAAVRIVKLAAPFARFPPDIRKEVDILHIERTWLFLSSNQFASR